MYDSLICYSWGRLKLKIQSVAEKFGCIVLAVNPNYTSQTCSNCSHVDSASRNPEKFVWTHCGFIVDADHQASVNIGMKGLELLGISPSKLLVDNQKVTAKSELTDLRNQDKSMALVVEPSNPLQLSLFEWINGQVTGCSESPTIARRV
ncbi:zinc ribbon domain-containing protein [Spirulina sp.]|uniref:zinc ribbon domain-containing protein n=2 Tax=Spirulina sp. TaxID=1157 RepID=UPI003F727B41